MHAFCLGFFAFLVELNFKFCFFFVFFPLGKNGVLFSVYLPDFFYIYMLYRPFPSILLRGRLGLFGPHVAGNLRVSHQS